MDPVTTAIIAALSAGATVGLADTTKTAITDSYNKLKDLLTKKFGASSDVVNAIEAIEAKPTSEGRQRTLVEEVTEVGADQDTELLALAKHIRDLLKDHAKNDMAMQQIITGDYNATSVHGDASVTIHAQDDV